MASMPVGAHLRAECARCRTGGWCADAAARRAWDEDDNPPVLPPAGPGPFAFLEGFEPITYRDRFGSTHWVDPMEQEKWR